MVPSVSSNESSTASSSSIKGWIPEKIVQMEARREMLGPYTVSDPDALSTDFAERVYGKVLAITFDYLSVDEEFRNEPLLSESDSYHGQGGLLSHSVSGSARRGAVVWTAKHNVVSEARQGQVF